MIIRSSTSSRRETSSSFVHWNRSTRRHLQELLTKQRDDVLARQQADVTWQPKLARELAQQPISKRVQGMNVGGCLTIRNE